MMLRRLFTALAIAALVACDAKPPAPPPAQFKNVDITGASYARGFTLTDVDGKQRTLQDYAGKAVVVFFGYTQCPDVCPTTLGELAAVKKALGPQGDRLQGVFITVDPERDTAEALKSYMSGFDPSFVALRGTPEQTLGVAKEFKVYYAKVPVKSGSYLMDHSAGSFVYDPSGRVRLFVRYGGDASDLASDLKVLLAGG